MVFGSKERDEKIQEILINHANILTEIKENQESIKNEFKQEIGKLKDKQNSYFKEFTQCIDAFTTLNLKYEKGIDGLNVIKRNLGEKMVEGIQKGVSADLKKKIEDIHRDLSAFDNLKKELAEISLSIKTVKQEINKFTIISNKIKEMDFNLINYNREMHNADKEKLELMKEVDSLQRLVGKLRRGNM